jgi:hypothetical protein
MFRESVTALLFPLVRHQSSAGRQAVDPALDGEKFVDAADRL